MVNRRTAIGVVLFMVIAAPAAARDQVRIVGSSTVFPFSTAVAEQLGRTGKVKTPIVESTGTGGGFKLFCNGIGPGHPDVTNASRRMKTSELDQCRANGVEVAEVKIGFDGIVLANSKTRPAFVLSAAQIFKALAAKVPAGGQLIPNPNKKWSDVDPSLPDLAIEVLGPPPTSGTRDAFVELAMEAGCAALAGAAELGLEKEACHAIREDGAYIDAGENDNLIVQKLVANPDAVGIFGYSFLDGNRDKLHAASVDGVPPTFENISGGSYELSRSLYFYVKIAHVPVIAGVREYVAEFTSERAFGPDGYLVDKGLIPLEDGERAKVMADAKQVAPLGSL